jgi:hypothetical protein
LQSPYGSGGAPLSAVSILAVTIAAIAAVGGLVGAAPAVALTGGVDDVDTPEANAVVRIEALYTEDGRIIDTIRCTGTLVTRVSEAR